MSSSKNVNSQDYAVGIDLGTTNSCVGVYRYGHVEIIANVQGRRWIPSHVSYFDDKEIVGSFAKIESMKNPKNTIYDAIRIIGRNLEDPAITEKLASRPFKVVNSQDNPKFEIPHTSKPILITPEEVSASVLKNLRDSAGNFLKCNVTKAVISVPAYFNDSQRKATIDAGKIAGFEMIKLVTEPTAAAISHGFKRNSPEKNILVYDLGGGTLDVTVLKTKGNEFEVLAVNGDNDLGGRDFDNMLVKYVLDQVKRNNGVDLSNDSKEMALLELKCESVKQNLSFNKVQSIQIDSCKRNLDVNLPITRSLFEEVCDDLFEKCCAPVEKALISSKLSKEDVDEVILTGGSTRIPKIQSMLKELFSGKKLTKSVNPDEAVASGAAILAAEMILESRLDDDIDYTPAALGIRVKGYKNQIVIPEGAKIPLTITKRFHTSNDYQKYFHICILEGDSKYASDTYILGEFFLENITEGPAGKVRYDVTFDIDSNGILNVSAIEPQSGSNNQICIESYRERLIHPEIKHLARVMVPVKIKD